MRALIVVDPQNDFMPGGALPAPRGDEIVPVANRLMEKFDLVVASQDWHPPDHASFATEHPGKKPGDVIELEGLKQELWPPHCVQHTEGAAFHKDVAAGRFAKVFHKGVDRNIDSYSAFFDNAHRRATGLGDYLKEKGVDEIYLLGLATDYCVKFSTLDAIQQGLKVNVIQDGCRAINVNPGDEEKALEEMQKAGAKIIRSTDLD